MNENNFRLILALSVCVRANTPSIIVHNANGLAILPRVTVVILLYAWTITVRNGMYNTTL